MRRGVVLIFVLVVVALLSLAALTFSELMLSEREASELAASRVQTTALVASGVEAARWLLAQDEQVQVDAGGWYDNAARFRGVIVVGDDDPRRRGRFSLVAPAMEDGRRRGIRFGLEDESTRLNLNAVLAAEQGKPDAGKTMLMTLPGMTEPIADAILDWMDADDQPRQFGVEQEYYSALDPPYAPRNGPLETIEELLLVRDVTPGMVFGVDANHNGVRDVQEADSQSIENVDNSEGVMDCGWAALLTLKSLERNAQADGSPRINVNQKDMKKLYPELEKTLGADQATFIVAYRQNGPYKGNEQGQSGANKKLDLTQEGKTSLGSVLDLIGARVQVKFEGDEQPTILTAVFSDQPGEMGRYLPKLMDCLSTTSSPTSGRININQASRTVLATIPGMTSDFIDQIIARRQVDPADRDASMRHATWLLSEGVVNLDQMKALLPYVCGGGNVFRTQAVGYFDQGGSPTRVEFFLDATKSPATVLFWRDMSHLGRGYPRETLGQ
jgi:type II secretory pathway component PulK